VSGYALYYISSDEQRHAAGVTHEIIGTSIVVAALVHWFGGYPRKRMMNFWTRMSPCSAAEPGDGTGSSRNRPSPSQR
jgi:hypothetical protein